jgi:hypothetical protein
MCVGSPRPGYSQTVHGLVRSEKVNCNYRFFYILIPTFESIMPISKCIVRLKDCHNSEHSVEVYAQSLYEAVLRGLNRLQDVEMLDGNPMERKRYSVSR